MRIRGQFKTKKSWCIKLVVGKYGEDSPDIYLSAVDENTEDLIIHIIRFSQDGKVVRMKDVNDCLEDAGYDPFEHNNSFDDEGRIEMDVVV